MVTARGWVVVGGAVAALVVGRMLGIAELFGLAFAGIILVVVARVYVSRGPGELTVWTKAEPQVVGLAEGARLDVRVHNVGRRRSRAALLRDRDYRGRREPIRIGEIVVSPLDPAGTGRIVLELPTIRRGAFELVDVGLAYEDPLGLACRTRPTGAEARLVVLPFIETLDELAPVGDMTDREEASRSAAVRLRTGLSSFRLYELGDDLRRVHWKTTARVGELMVREGGDPESPDSRSVTVVLDCRRAVHSAETFETAVSAAASVIDTAAHHGSGIRLVTTTGVDTGLVLEEADVEGALTELAVAATKESHRDVLAHLRSGRVESAGVVVGITTSRCSAEDAHLLFPSRPGSARDVLVSVRERGEPAAAEEDLDFGPALVSVVAGSSVAEAWQVAFGSTPLPGLTSRSATSEAATSEAATSEAAS